MKYQVGDLIYISMLRSFHVIIENAGHTCFYLPKDSSSCNYFQEHHVDAIGVIRMA
jgi:hypothetical protein